MEKTILLVVLLSLVAILLSMPHQMFIPFFCVDILHIDEGSGGILMGVSGAGAIFSSIVLASLPNKKRGLMMLVSSIILGFSLTGFSFSQTFALSTVSIIFVGVGQSANMTLSSTLIQYYAEKEYRGRVMSIMMMQFGLMSFSTFLAGLLTEALGIQWAIGSLAIVLVLLSFFAMTFFKRIRNLE